jgi:hypothetical protein
MSIVSMKMKHRYVLMDNTRVIIEKDIKKQGTLSIVP